MKTTIAKVVSNDSATMYTLTITDLTGGKLAALRHLCGSDRTDTVLQEEVGQSIRDAIDKTCT